MGKYVVKRLLWMIPIVLGVAVLVFTLMTFCPGDPAEIILGSTATEESLMLKRTELGLDDPYLVRLGTFLSDTFLHFDLGESWMSGVSIADSIKEYLPRTLVLSIIMISISATVGIPLGVIAAVKQNQWQDNLCMVLALIGISIPSFWLALLLVILFSVKLNWLPAMGIGGFKYYRNLLGGLYRENPVKSRNYEAVKSSKKWENVGNSYIIPALLLYRYSYI